MENVAISSRLHMETSPEFVKFIRTGVYRRTVYVPRKVIYLSLLHGRCIEDLNPAVPDEIVLTAIDDWVIAVTSFKGKRYMCYTKMDEHGKRVG